MMGVLAASPGRRVSHVDSDLGRIVYGFRQWRDEPFAVKYPRPLAELEQCLWERVRLMEMGGHE